MELYRIAHEHYATDLSGTGARLYGGRWNSEGTAALYTASTRALALLETLVHTPLHVLKQKKFLLVTLQLPDETTVEKIDLRKLPSGWDVWDLKQHTQQLGDRFLQHNKKLLLQVPSVLVPEEFNYVLNPSHPHMSRLKVLQQRPLLWNERFFRAV
jgi:RES domain-containing protein